MSEIYTYLAPLPRGVREMVLPCADGHTVYIDERLDDEMRMKAFKHALGHITRGDFQKSDVQGIESAAHSESA